MSRLMSASVDRSPQARTDKSARSGSDLFRADKAVRAPVSAYLERTPWTGGRISILPPDRDGPRPQRVAGLRWSEQAQACWAGRPAANLDGSRSAGGSAKMHPGMGQPPAIALAFKRSACYSGLVQTNHAPRHDASHFCHCPVGFLGDGL